MDSVFKNQVQPEKVPIPLSPRDAFGYLKDNAAIVDIRPQYEIDYRIFDVPRIYYLPFDSYRDNFHIIPKETALVIADSVGHRSTEVACFLLSQGYRQVAYLVGGVVDWNRDGLPLVKDADYELVGGCACRLQPKKLRVEGSTVAPKLREDYD